MANLKNTKVNDATFRLPVGTSAEEVTGIRNGSLRFNTDLGKIQIFLNGGWVDIGD